MLNSLNRLVYSKSEHIKNIRKNINYSTTATEVNILNYTGSFHLTQICVLNWQLVIQHYKMLKTINCRCGNVANDAMAISHYKPKITKDLSSFTILVLHINAFKNVRKILDNFKTLKSRDYKVVDLIVSSTHLFFCFPSLCLYPLLSSFASSYTKMKNGR